MNVVADRPRFRSLWAMFPRPSRPAVLSALLVGLFALAGLGVVLNPTRIVEAIGGLGMLASVALVPDLVLLVLVPGLVYLSPHLPAKFLIAIPGLLIIDALAGIYSGKRRFAPVPHLMVLLFCTWMVFCYQNGKMHGGQSPLAQQDTINTIVAVLIGGVAIAVRPSHRQVLTAVALLGAVMAFVARSNAAAVTSTSTTAAGDLRVAVLGLDPNGVGAILAVGLTAAVAKFIITRHPAWIFVIAITLSGFPLAKSRGSLVIALAGLTGLVLFRQSNRIRVGIAALAVVVLVFVPSVKRGVISATLQDRAKHLSAQSTDARQLVAIKGVRLGLSHPLTGVGWARFPSYAAADPKIGVGLNTHNDYARLFAEGGLPALGLVLGFFYLAVRAKPADEDDWALKGVVFAIAANFFVVNLLSNPPTAVPYLIVLGSVIGTDAERRAHRLPPYDVAAHPVPAVAGAA